jgi:hypothetical protein
MTAQDFEQQAARAERLARSILDHAASEALMELAREYRERANQLNLVRKIDPTPSLGCPRFQHLQEDMHDSKAGEALNCCVG